MRYLIRHRLIPSILLALALISCGAPDAAPAPAPGQAAPGQAATPLIVGATPTAGGPPATAERVNAAPQRWSAKPVVASIYSGPGYTNESVAWSIMPSLVIYADGTIIKTDLGYAGNRFTRSAQIAQVGPAEVCGILRRVEALGFFDFNPADYPTPNVTDNGTTTIIVDAWRAREFSAYALGWALSPPDFLDPSESPPVPAGLVDSYRFLAGYAPAGLKPYQPERVALRITPSRGEGAALLWPLASPALADLVAGLDPEEPETVLSGAQAAQVYALFGSDNRQLFSAGGRNYEVTARPLLPRETWEVRSGWGRPSIFEQEPAVELSCEGGAVELPPIAPAAPAATPTPDTLAAPLEYLESLGGFESHAAFAVSAKGDAWVLDTGDTIARQSPPKRLLHFDAEGELLLAFDQLGGRDFACDSYALAARSDQTALLADPCAGTVTHLDAGGAVIASWGSRGLGAGEFNLLADMALAPDEQSVYLLDAGRRAIEQRGLDGAPLASWSAAQLGVAEPGAIALDGQGGFVLVDRASAMVVVAPAGGQPRAWALPAQYDTPNQVAVDSARGRVYVGGTDATLYVFDLAGGYLGHEQVLDSRNVMVRLGPEGRVYRSAGYQEIQVYEPR